MVLPETASAASAVGGGTEHCVLHRILGEHLDPFLREGSDRGDGPGLPRFVEHRREATERAIVRPMRPPDRAT